MADYTFDGKSIHVDAHMPDGVDFKESFYYLDKNKQPINLTGYTAKLVIYDVDDESLAPAISGDHTDGKVILGGGTGKVTVSLTSQDIANLVKPCYKWAVFLNDSFRFMRGYVYRNQLL